MAFLRKNLTPVGGQSRRGVAPQQYSYKTQDAAAVVQAIGYFDEVRDILEVGDRIYVLQVDIAGIVLAAADHIVLSITAGTGRQVDVSNATALTITNI